MKFEVGDEVMYGRSCRAIGIVVGISDTQIEVKWSWFTPHKLTYSIKSAPVFLTPACKNEKKLKIALGIK